MQTPRLTAPAIAFLRPFRYTPSMKKRKAVSVLAPLLVIAAAGGWLVFKKLNPSPSITRVLCMGDSITSSGYGDYTRQLAARFRDVEAEVEVIAEARPGNTSGEYLDWMHATHPLEKANPHLVILMLGTNDARIDGDRTPTPRFLANMEAILNRIKSHRNPDTTTPRIILATIPPIPSLSLAVFNRESQRRVEEEINPAIRKLAASRRLHLADVHGFFKKRIKLMAGVHPSPEGYRALGDFLFREARTFVAGRRPAPGEERLPAGLSGTIAFESNRSGNFDIYLLNSSGVRRLTRSPARDGYPSFSPGGDRIAFESDREGRFEIHASDREGNVRRLFPSPTQDRSPWWSRDGRFIYFARRVNGREQIFRYAFSDHRAEAVTRRNRRTGLPTVSPDGKTLLITGHRLMGWNLFRIHLADGKEEVFSPGYAGCRAKFSHSGTFVAFVSHKFDHRGDIILTPGDTFAPIRLTVDGERHDYYPAFSPDDQYIVYASGPQLIDGNYDLRIMEISTRRIWTITNHPATDYKPVWSR